MKNSYLLLAAFIFSGLRISAVNLKEAIANKQISVEVTGSNYDSIPSSLRNGFAPKMQMTVSNLSNEPLDIDLDPGYMLEASESGYQAMLLTQAVALKLNGNEKKRNYLYAMCTEISKSGPNSSLHYRVADLAKPALLQMATFIASKKYLVHGAQQAVWSISDDLPISSITDADPVIQKDLQQQAASIKGVHFDELKNEYERRKGVQMAAFDGQKLDRNITFSVKDTALVSVGFYDGQGNLIRPIFNNRLFREGKHSIRYNPYPLAFAGKQYTVRMMKDGSLYREYYFMQ